MATQVGRILLLPQGDYNAGTTYNMLDWVRHSGAAWVCKQDGTINVTPSLSATAYWALLSEDGSVGGWSSISNKPFETLGKGVKKDVDDSLTLEIGTNLLLGSKLDVDVQSTYSGTGTKPINGTGVKLALDAIQDGSTINNFSGVESALNDKADDSDLDNWVTTTGTDGVVNNGSVTFSGIDDTVEYGYEPFPKFTSLTSELNPTFEISNVTGLGTSSMSVTFSTNFDNGGIVKLRRIK